MALSLSLDLAFIAPLDRSNSAGHAVSLHKYVILHISDCYEAVFATSSGYLLR